MARLRCCCVHPHCLSLLLLTGLSVPCSFHALTGKLRDLRIAEIELRRIYVKKIEMQRKHWKIILREQELLQQVQGRCGGGEVEIERERGVGERESACDVGIWPRLQFTSNCFHTQTQTQTQTHTHSACINGTHGWHACLVCMIQTSLYKLHVQSESTLLQLRAKADKIEKQRLGAMHGGDNREGRGSRERERESVCVCVCLSVCTRLCVCLCAHVCRCSGAHAKGERLKEEQLRTQAAEMKGRTRAC